MSRLIDFALRQRVLMVVLMVAMFVAGVVGFLRLNIEAYPDPVPPLVDIITQSPGQSAEEVERYLTIPLEVQMAGMPNMSSIRTTSLFGLSDVQIQFTYDVSHREAEQLVTNRLAQMAPLPGGAQPQISPTSPIGEIFRYRLKAPAGFSVTELKTLQDWLLQRRFKAIAGVIDVTCWGGRTKVYEVTVDQARLTAQGVALGQVLAALNASNTNVGGQKLNLGPQSVVVRGVGLIRSADDVLATLVAQNHGTPVRLRDVATVTSGFQPRLGIAGLDDDDDIVEGVVLMRRGAQSKPTIARVKAEIDRINASGLLPPGVSLEKIYDRSELIDLTTHTVLHNMLLGIVLIFALQWLFLGDLRSAVIVAATIPFALAFAICLLVWRGESANLLSVGAIDFGLIVDATVIMVENIVRHLSEAAEAPRSSEVPGWRGRFELIARSAVEVTRPILFSSAIIIAGFVPLFTMSGIEGHIFGPMAKTYAYAIAGGILATFTVSPALASFLLKAGHEERETLVVRWIRRGHAPVARAAMQRRGRVLAGAAIVLLLTAWVASRLGLEFLPRLEEGNLWIHATLPLSISLEEGDAYVNDMRRLISSYPETQTTVSQHGRPEDGTDATGFFNVEFFVPLKPLGQWPAGVDKAALTADMAARLHDQFPGVEFGFSQYIEDNVEEAASGVKGGENAVKVFGPELAELERITQHIANTLKGVPGVTDLSALRSLGQPTLDIKVDRDRAARFGLSTGEVNAAVQLALAGQSAGDLYEAGSDRHFPLVVRLAQRYRGDVEAIKRIGITAPHPSGSGTVRIALADVADVALVSGASFIYRQQQERYVPVRFGVRGRDLGGAVLEAQRRVAAEVHLPPGYRLEWVGQFGNLEEALQRLAIATPLSLVLIGLLLYLHFGRLRDVVLVASVIPMAMIGGVLALFVTATPFSVSAAIGFVALFGIAAMDGILMLSCYNQFIAQGVARVDALQRMGELQLRPVTMTCVVACVGLIPAAFSTGVGAQVQRPLALVVVGGILLAPVFILGVLPVLIDWVSDREVGRGSESSPAIALAGAA